MTRSEFVAALEPHVGRPGCTDTWRRLVAESATDACRDAGWVVVADDPA
jgi:hypothetical protein